MSFAATGKPLRGLYLHKHLDGNGAGAKDKYSRLIAKRKFCPELLAHGAVVGFPNSAPLGTPLLLPNDTESQCQSSLLRQAAELKEELSSESNS